uniref:Ion-translocating oxidoreductase complex subunit G n=1 Tax=Candidatus Kentrum sp. SD TaxID=2126332 RepID=A0A450YGL8_9GAMM|nr:MAG: electron transport complex protein RnfG [Candidatus Kentron sp. SD]VFK40677.1 MAG: electron transport complex protein RnfG [Candidatus Kentron sp. SD]VFK79625.1 MAG: electron transport complex protein RnfG [Candidatus Kentron sp. SD]
MNEEVRFDSQEKGQQERVGDETPIMPPTMPMIIVLGLIAMLSGVLVVLVYEYTSPIIAEKERKALEAAVFQVLPGIDLGTARQAAFFINTEGKLIEYNKETEANARKEKKEPFYAVYDSSNALLGIAMQGAAQGYQDIVRILFGYDVGKQQVVGMTVLKSVDTPGLGDKKTVEKNQKFMANFNALDVSLTEDKTAIEHPIETVKNGSKTEGWQVDAMSGATITSRAIAKGIDNTVSELLPLLVKHLPIIRSVKIAKIEVKN